MLRSSLALCALLFALASYSPAYAAGYAVDPSTSAVTFQAIGTPGFLHVNGAGGKVTGGPGGTFTVTLSDFATGIDLRDKHMKEKYLEVAKYPVATLKLATVPTVSGAFTGTLTLHGVMKAVSGDVTLTPQGKRLSVVAEFPVVLSDFGIAVPSWLGVTVAQNVTVSVSFVADPTP
jgi:polyisoprenoid-binding protein YceI